MSVLDHALVVVIVAAACAALVWRLALSRRPPACAPTVETPHVVVSPGLGRALARAEAKRRAGVPDDTSPRGRASRATESCH